MTFEEVHTKLAEKFPKAVLERTDSKPDPSIKIDPAQIHAVAGYLKEELSFESLSNLSGIDYPALPALSVIYHLFSFHHRVMVALKVYLPREEAPKIQSLCDLYKSANWMEREAYDLFGVHFENHPDHRRILLPPDWVGYPMRKDYVTPDYYNGMPVPLYFDDKAATPKEGGHG